MVDMRRGHFRYYPWFSFHQLFQDVAVVVSALLWSRFEYEKIETVPVVVEMAGTSKVVAAALSARCFQYCYLDFSIAFRRRMIEYLDVL